MPHCVSWNDNCQRTALNQAAGIVYPLMTRPLPLHWSDTYYNNMITGTRLRSLSLTFEQPILLNFAIVHDQIEAVRERILSHPTNDTSIQTLCHVSE